MKGRDNIVLKKVKLKFNIYHNNTPTKVNLYGASYSILLDNLLNKDEAVYVHNNGKIFFSLSPLYIDFKQNLAIMYVAAWSDEGINLINKMRDRLLFKDIAFNFDLNGENIIFRFDSYYECNNDCFTMDFKDINNIPIKDINEANILFETPFFIKLGNRNYCYPDINVLCNSLKKNQEKIEGYFDEFETKNLFPISFNIKNIKVRYSGMNMYGCIGYIKIDISNLSYKEKEIFIKQLIYSEYIGLGAKNAHGFGRISIKFNDKSIYELIRG